MRINFKFEAPILQIQIITYVNLIRYAQWKYQHIFTVCHSRQDNSYMICCLPIQEIHINYQNCYIDICIYSYIERFWHRVFVISPAVYRNFGWAIIEELSVRR